MAEPPVIDVEALVEDLRGRVAQAKAEGLYGDDLSGVALRAPAPEARVRFRPELAYSTKPLVGKPLTAVKKVLIRLLVHVFDDLARQADAGIAAAEGAARDARAWAGAGGGRRGRRARAHRRRRRGPRRADRRARGAARAPAGGPAPGPSGAAPGPCAGRSGGRGGAGGARPPATRASTTWRSRPASGAPRRPCASARRSTGATWRAAAGPSTSGAGGASCWS